jgi:hypothetical protein
MTVSTLKAAWLILILGTWLADALVELLNHPPGRAPEAKRIPAEFDGFFDAAKYRESLTYQNAKSRAALLRETVVTVVTVAFLLAGELVATADAGWRKLQAAYVVAPLVAVDDALRRMNSNRYINGNLL